MLWYNFLATGRGDRNALHAGCPVGENETKWSGNKWVRNKPWGTEGHWIQGHPALKRFGFLADDQNEVAKACHLALESFYDEPITLLWLHEGLRNELATVPPRLAFDLKGSVSHHFTSILSHFSFIFHALTMSRSRFQGTAPWRSSPMMATSSRCVPASA